MLQNLAKPGETWQNRTKPGETWRNLAECHKILAKEHANALIVRSRMEGEVFKHTMRGLNLGESKEPKVEVENTNGLAKVPEETDPQHLREEAQGLTAIIETEIKELEVTQAAKVLEDTNSLAQ